MTATLVQKPIPDHVPAELVHPYPLMHGEFTYDDPFKTIIPKMHEGLHAIYSPNAWSGQENAWVFRREPDVRAIFMDTEHFSSKETNPFPLLVGENWQTLPIEADVPAHRGYRSILAPLFTPVTVGAMVEDMRGYVREYINEFRSNGQCEVMKELAARFPIKVFLGLFGLPLEEVDQFMAWEFELIHGADMAKKGEAVRAVKNRILAEMNDRRQNPQNDLITHIVQSKVEGRLLTDDEGFGIAFNLYLGGLDTVTTNIGWQLRHLANDIELQEKLRSDPSLIPEAVDEMLRAYSSVAISRTCIKETVVGGITIKPGDKVMLSTSLASNDPEVFENPTEVKLGRKERHLGFGTGIHSCVGLRLARQELIIAHEEFLKAIPTFRLADDAKILTHLSAVMQQDCVPLVWSV